MTAAVDWAAAGAILKILALALALGIAIAATYVVAYRGLYQSKTFVHTCVVTVPLVSVAVRAVVAAASATEASAIAFALVGLLGLIRLRTVVRDTREFTFVFLALVTGAGIGAGDYLLATIGCLVLLAVLAALEALDFGALRSPSLRVRIGGDAGSFATYRDALMQLASRLEATAIRRLSGDSAEFQFEIVARKDVDMAKVAERLRALEGVAEVSISHLQRGRATGDDEG
jgi:hypothetical protein